MDFSLTVAFSVALAAYTLITLWRSRYRVTASHPLPPGPPPLPIIGNVLGISPEEPWASYTRWGKTYGRYLFASSSTGPI